MTINYAEGLTDPCHPCTREGCKETVGFDDEPFCFTHSPDSGSDVRGYSYRASTGKCGRCHRILGPSHMGICDGPEIDGKGPEYTKAHTEMLSSLQERNTDDKGYW